MITLITMLVLLPGCSSTTSEIANNTNIPELVDDYSTGRIQENSASITSEELIIITDEGEIVHELTNEDFFVSIAPYLTQTHP